MIPRGFIALTSSIMISVVLLLVATAGSFSGFYTRGVVLDAELKERSRASADGCVSFVLMRLAQDAQYAGSETLTLNQLDTCSVGAIIGGAQKLLRVQAISSGRAVTNVEVTYDVNSKTALTWLEVLR